VGHIDSRRPFGREPAVDLGFHDGLDKNVAGQPDVDRAEAGGCGEQGGGRFRGLASEW